MPRTGSIRQRRLISLILENPRLSLSAAMRKVGFSDAYAKHPEELLNTKSFQGLLALIDNADLLNEHYWLATQRRDLRVKMSAISEFYTLKDLRPATKLKITQFNEESARYQDAQEVTPIVTPALSSGERQ